MNDPTEQRFLITGGLGCIGAWTVKHLVDDGSGVVTLDKGGDPKRLSLVMGDGVPEQVRMIDGDITDLEGIERVLDEHDITNVIHLAALQVPFARANPPLGAMVNVVGTINVLEAVKRRSDRISRVVYASSLGMFDAIDADPDDGRLHEDAFAHPRTHYGVYKMANEGNARVYWLDDGISSVGLRPMTIFGPGRDQGLTSGPSRAILSALVGRPFEIGFGGRMLFQYAPDAARTFISASRSTREGALVYNMNGTLASIDEFIAAIDRHVPGAADLITRAADPLPLPEEIDSDSLAEVGEAPITPLDEAIAATVALFRTRLDAGLVPEEHGLAA